MPAQEPTSGDPVELMRASAQASEVQMGSTLVVAQRSAARMVWARGQGFALEAGPVAGHCQEILVALDPAEVGPWPDRHPQAASIREAGRGRLIVRRRLASLPN